MDSLLPLNTLPLFMTASLILLLTPGPAVLYIIARSVDQGRRAGLASMLGIQTGGLVQVIAAALGLSAVLWTSEMAFNVVKYLGAAYLIYLGVRIDSNQGHRINPSSRRAADFLARVIVNMFNPGDAVLMAFRRSSWTRRGDR
jgi:threonine/homoserine/homoserine lactone efflux protein